MQISVSLDFGVHPVLQVVIFNKQMPNMHLLALDLLL